MRFQQGVDDRPTRLPISATEREASSCNTARIFRSIASIALMAPGAIKPGRQARLGRTFLAKPAISSLEQFFSISSPNSPAIRLHRAPTARSRAAPLPSPDQTRRPPTSRSGKRERKGASGRRCRSVDKGHLAGRGGKPVLKQVLDQIDGLGPAVVIALHLHAALVAETPQLLLGLDPLGACGDPQRLAETGHGAHDRRRIGILLQVLHEGAVDLDLVEGEAAKIAQRRVAGTEVVHRDANSQRLELLQSRQVLFDVAQQQRFGDLELEPIRRETRLVENLCDTVEKIVLPELRRRDVDRDPHRLRPVSGVKACAPKHPIAQSNDETGLFREGNELHWRPETSSRMAPSYQRLEAEDAAV